MIELGDLPGGWLVNHLRQVRRTHLAQRAYKRKWPSCKFLGDSTISDGVTLGDGCILNRVNFNGKVDVGRHTLANRECHFSGDISIGSFCSIARQVMMITGTHPLAALSTFHSRHSILESIFSFPQPSPAPIVVGSDVWIGAGAILLPGVNIGHGAVVGAGAVVATTVEPYSLVVGCPARHVRYRFSEDKINLLLQSKWWEWSDGTIKQHRSLFKQDFAQSTLERIADELERVSNGNATGS